MLKTIIGTIQFILVNFIMLGTSECLVAIGVYTLEMQGHPILGIMLFIVGMIWIVRSGLEMEKYWQEHYLSELGKLMKKD